MHVGRGKRGREGGGERERYHVRPRCDVQVWPTCCRLEEGDSSAAANAVPNGVLHEGSALARLGRASGWRSECKVTNMRAMFSWAHRKVCMVGGGGAWTNGGGRGWVYLSVVVDLLVALLKAGQHEFFGEGVVLVRNVGCERSFEADRQAG